MDDSTTARIQGCLDRMRNGDAQARDDLLRFAWQRLERLARKILGDFRRVRRWEETADVLQNALVRLCRALEAESPADVRQFHRLAVLQIRRELTDLARHYFGPHGAGARHHSARALPGSSDDSAASAPADPACPEGEPHRLAQWTEFHRHAESLPESVREVFDLLWYQGLSQAEAAEVLGVSDRTVKTRWRSARLTLHKAMGGELPDLA